MDAAEGETGADQAVNEPSEIPVGTTHPGDAELAAIVRTVDQGQVGGLRLTLLVGGTLISGELVSAAQWWEGMAQQARAAGGGSANAQFAEGADVASQLYREAEIESRPIGYVHMQDVVTPNNRTVEWRIRIEGVQAWRWGP